MHQKHMICTLYEKAIAAHRSKQQNWLTSDKTITCTSWKLYLTNGKHLKSTSGL